MLTARWWRELGISEHVSLELNSIGSLEARANYRDALVAYLEQFTDKLDEDSKRRMYTNPLRVLDSKTRTFRRCSTTRRRSAIILTKSRKPTLPACARCLTMPVSATPSTSAWCAALITITAPCSSG